MSRFENVAHPSIHDRAISQRMQCLPCGRCYAVIEYHQGQMWNVVNELVNEHYRACPGKPSARPACIASIYASPPETAIVLPPPAASSDRSSSNPAAEPASPPNNAWSSLGGCERKRRTLEQRKLELEQDEYARNVTTKSVVCGGCHKEISLDKRSKYYPGLWLKHKRKCAGVQKLERAKAEVVAPANGCADVEERFERAVRHLDGEDSSSDEGDEGADGPTPEPFPTLNGDFYRSEQVHERSGVWAYRYATKDEITANFFRGQGEPYGPPLHTGSHCETLGRVVKN